jgi:hypothetical protein
MVHIFKKIKLFDNCFVFFCFKLFERDAAANDYFIATYIEIRSHLEEILKVPLLSPYIQLQKSRDQFEKRQHYR